MTFDYRKQYQEYRQYIDSIVEKARLRLPGYLWPWSGLSLLPFFLAVFALRPTLITVAGLWKEINTEKKYIMAWTES